MAKKTPDQKMMNKWVIRLLLFVVFLALGYGFASMAIDSGNLLEYAIAVLFVAWAVIHLVRGTRILLAK